MIKNEKIKPHSGALKTQRSLCDLEIIKEFFG